MLAAFRRHNLALAMIASAAFIALVYWPARHGGFVLDDSTQLHDEAWLRSDVWYRFALRGFNDWVNYFRPLVVLLFAAEVRAFDGAPGPMHIVSIGLHLANTFFVGLLSLRMFAGHAMPRYGSIIAMLVYGLHPALIEPVNWVGLQFDLVVVLCMLLGLLFNMTTIGARWRAMAVAASFFLATCAKEAAVVFPVLLVLSDLARDPRWRNGANLREFARNLWREQKGVYIGVAAAGIAYLVLRFYAIGFAAARPAAEPLLSLAHFNKICLTYIAYWKLLVLPTSAIGPIHPYDPAALVGLGWRNLCVDLAAVAIAAASLWSLCKRQLAGLLATGVSAALLPTLNFVPFIVNSSLYQDRYAAMAVAFACTLLPALLAQALRYATSPMRTIAVLGVAAWLAVCAWIVHTTIPAWADDVALCQWALRQHPDSVFAKSQLLDAYLARDDHQHARPLADELVAAGAQCPGCVLDAAFLALSENDAARASFALDKLKDAPILGYDKTVLRKFILANALLLDIENRSNEAEAAFRDAIAIDAFDPEPLLALASLQARQGNVPLARQTAERGFALLAPDQRDARRRAFEQSLSGKR